MKLKDLVKAEKQSSSALFTKNDWGRVKRNNPSKLILPFPEYSKKHLTSNRPLFSLTYIYFTIYLLPLPDPQ
jgi:hypothetical protein